jgi:hypothetical protein
MCFLEPLVKLQYGYAWQVVADRKGGSTDSAKRALTISHLRRNELVRLTDTGQIN